MKNTPPILDVIKAMNENVLKVRRSNSISEDYKHDLLIESMTYDRVIALFEDDDYYCKMEETFITKGDN